MTTESEMERPRVSADWDTWDHDPGHVSHVSSAVSSPRTQVSESSLNSMEYWDYSVELECITGQQGTHRREECHALKEETRLSLWLLLGGLYITDRCSKSPLVTATMSHQGEL